MPRYLIVRKFSVTETEMPRIGTKSKKVGMGMPGIVWEHSHVIVDENGMAGTYCVYEAPDEQTVRDHAMALGEHEYWIQEIVGDVTPDDFPLDGETGGLAARARRVGRDSPRPARGTAPGTRPRASCRCRGGARRRPAAA